MIRTTYDGPSTTETHFFGGRPVRLVRPMDPDRLLNDAKVLDLNRTDDYMPYWAYLWPGTYLLAETIAREAWIPATAALELGCGLGLAGLVGVAHGLKVVFSDYDDAPLRFVEKSAAANGFHRDRFSTLVIDWRNPPNRRFPVILGADLLYERRLVPLVCDAISAMLAPQGFALVAGPYRVATEDLEACMVARGLSSQSQSIEVPSREGSPIRGTLHRITRREDGIG